MHNHGQTFANFGGNLDNQQQTRDQGNDCKVLIEDTADNGGGDFGIKSDNDDNDDDNGEDELLFQFRTSGHQLADDNFNDQLNLDDPQFNNELDFNDNL